MKSCENCGAEISLNAQYCPNCGNGINTLENFENYKMESVSTFESIFGVPEYKKTELLRNINDDEEIVFQKWNETNLCDEAWHDIQVGVIYTGIILFCFLLSLLIFTPKKLDMMIIFFGASIVLLLVALYPLVKGLKHYFRIKRKMNLSRVELKHYVEAGILTDKRWIEKSYNIVNLDFSRFPERILEKKGDLIFIDIDNISLIYSRTDIHNLIEIEIFLDSLKIESLPLKLKKFIVPIIEFEKFLKDIENKLQCNLERGIDGSGTIQFHKKKQKLKKLG